MEHFDQRLVGRKPMEHLDLLLQKMNYFSGRGIRHRGCRPEKDFRKEMRVGMDTMILEQKSDIVVIQYMFPGQDLFSQDFAPFGKRVAMGMGERPVMFGEKIF
jgi:hypothetical protein